jgi:uncharacterized membrane protein
MPAATAHPAPATAVLAPRRLWQIDALRGAAVVAMIAYHFAFDLYFFSIADVGIFTSPFWLGMRQVIPAVFLTVSGISLVLGFRPGSVGNAVYLKRLGRIALGAVAVTLATWFAIRDYYVFFGILHCIALASLLLWPLFLLRGPLAILLPAILGLLALALPHLVALPLFDKPLLLWVGLGTYFPETNDYVPLLPWAGYIALGIAFARAAAQPGRLRSWLRRLADLPAPVIARPLAWLGQHALGVYLLHQPLLLGLLFSTLWLASRIRL